MDGIPCFRVFGDDWASGKGYEIMMVYDGSQWLFLDAAANTLNPTDVYEGLVQAEDAFASFGSTFAPWKITFDYNYDCESDMSLWGIPNGVSFGSGKRKGDCYRVFYDKEDKKIKMGYYDSLSCLQMKNLHCYGSDKLTAADGSVPSGLTEYAKLDCYETLQRGAGNCTEFCVCFRDLCILSGIDCFCIMGAMESSNLYFVGGDGSDHGWNLVRPDGEWWFVEPQYTQLGYDFDDFPYFPLYIGQGYSGNGNPVAVSEEGLRLQRIWSGTALCYQFEEDGELAIYARTSAGVYADYDGSHDDGGMNFSTDENGKLKEKYGFVTWEKTVNTEDGKVVEIWQGYLRHGYLCMGPTVIDGEPYEFGAVKHSMGYSVSVGRKIGEKKHYRIGRMDIEPIADVAYTGTAICPKPVIKHGDVLLVEGRDYEIVSYSKNTEVTPSYSSGATCEIEGRGDYYDTATRRFKIVKRDISDMDVSMEWSERTWSRELDAGSGYGQPEVSIDMPISEYTVSYSRFNNVGTGTIVITGRYNCTGAIRKTCELKPCVMTGDEFEIVLSQGSYTYTGAEQRPEVTVRWLKEDGTLWRNLNLSEYDVAYENNVEAGKAKVLVDGRGKFAGRLEAEFAIQKQTGNDPNPGGNDPNPVGDNPNPGGSDPNPGGNDPNSVGDNPNPGGSDPNPGTNVQTPSKTEKTQEKIKKPGKPTIKKLKNIKAKKVTLTLSKKVSGATGYQVAYATKTSMKGQKKKTFKGTSVTIKGLKKGKTYYFRVRAYTKKNGGTVYGSWGNKKKIKIRK